MAVRLNETSIRCFKHCHSDLNVYCFTLPTRCPMCQQIVTTYLIPPFVIPNPLVTGSDIKAYSIIVKPTIGSFLRYERFVFLLCRGREALACKQLVRWVGF